jgi:hypothetical protein
VVEDHSDVAAPVQVGEDLGERDSFGEGQHGGRDLAAGCRVCGPGCAIAG